MTTNVFFNNYDSHSEKQLIEDLIIESIKMYGIDLYYCPRLLNDVDTTFNEDESSIYNTAYLIEMYIKNVEGFEGEGDFLSKFNIQIRDEITFTVARRIYNNEIGATEGESRPGEGDLIYFPLTEKVYQVKHVEHEPVFYQMGALQAYDLRCELFEYSNEDLNTGIDEIDSLETKWSTNVAVGNNADTYANGDIVINANTGRPLNISNTYSLDSEADNESLETDGDAIIDWTEVDPFSEGNI
jgi:hypothetical protein